MDQFSALAAVGALIAAIVGEDSLAGKMTGGTHVIKGTGLDDRGLLMLFLMIEKEYERQLDLGTLRSWHLQSLQGFSQFVTDSLGAPLTPVERELRSMTIKALAALHVGLEDEASALCDAIFRVEGGETLGYVVRSFIQFPGPTYIERLAELHRAREPRTYVEIGVATGSSMSRALPPTVCVGIDPEPAANLRFEAETRLFTATSDEFFATHDLRCVLQGRAVDLAFIDGMHLFENVLSDFVNLERFCSRDGAVLLHDCLPIDATVAARERKTLFWTGDVWRMLPVLARFRPDLRITVMKCAPSGLVMVSHLDPQSCVLSQQRERAIAYGMGMDLAEMPSLQSMRITIDG